MADRDLIAEAHQALDKAGPLTDLELRAAAVHGWVAHDSSTGERPWGQLAARASAELLAARARIAELEEQAAGRTVMGAEQFDAMLAALDTPDAAPNLAARVRSMVEQQTGRTLGYVVVLKDDDELTCLAPVFGPDDARTAEGIGAGYASRGEEYLIAELREVSGDE